LTAYIFAIALAQLVLGPLLVLLGVGYGVLAWVSGSKAGIPSSSGTVMLAALPVLLGVQLVLGFLSYDMHNSPRQVVHRRLQPPG